MEYKFVTGLEVKSDAGNESGNTIVGYASVFGNTDRVGDVVQKGAFVKSLENLKPVLLWNHNHNEPIGVWDEVVEDEKGLKVTGRINTETTKGREVLSLIKQGAVSGLSIGCRVDDSDYVGGVRVLKELTLAEISVVSIPANAAAQISAVKSAEAMNAINDPAFIEAVAKAVSELNTKNIEAETAIQADEAAFVADIEKSELIELINKRINSFTK